MKPNLAWFTGLALVFAAVAGCGGAAQWHFYSPQDTAHYNAVASQIENPNVGPSCDDQAMSSQPPEIVGRDGQIQFWDMTLEEAVQNCLSRSKVMHDLGGSVLRFPDRAPTIVGPAIAQTDPRYGVDAALSQYDAVFNYKYDAQHNDRLLNNIFFGGGTRDLKQDLDTFNAEITKETPTGTQFAFRNNTVYDHNNEPGNEFGGAWDTNFEAAVRQHLLQGGGVEYNNIVGPNGGPGQYNGVLIARINTDVALTEFEKGMRDLISNVENAYWDLYFAYRDLDAKVAARDSALESWRRTHALFQAGRRGGEAEKEAAAREQYFQFQEEVENAWSGRLVDGTQTNNGSSGGTLRSNGGVRVAERRLRLLIGLPISDGRLIRPADEPSMARVVFSWDDILPEALMRREELRQQRWVVKRQELVLIASKNFLLPTLDAFGLYRWRGFGHDLINSDTNPADAESALADLTSGAHQEWEMGAVLSIPLGERKGHAAVRNAQLSLARERVVLEDQEQHVVLDLSNALADVERSYQVAQTAYNRRMAARAEVAATKAAFEADKVPLDLYLEAQRRLADAESRFFAALVEYALAVKNVHYEKGSLLDYDEVYLAEGAWPEKAYADAAKRRPARWNPIDYTMKPGPVSAGPVEHHLGPPPQMGSQEQQGQPQPQGQVQGTNPPPASSNSPPASGPPAFGPPATAPPAPLPPPPGPSAPNPLPLPPPPLRLPLNSSDLPPSPQQAQQQPDLRPRPDQRLPYPVVQAAPTRGPMACDTSSQLRLVNLPQVATLPPPGNNGQGPMAAALLPPDAGPIPSPAGASPGLPRQNGPFTNSNSAGAMPAQSATPDWRSAPSQGSTTLLIRPASPAASWPESTLPSLPASAGGAIPLPTELPSETDGANWGVRPAMYSAPAIGNPAAPAVPIPVLLPPTGFEPFPSSGGLQPLPPLGAWQDLPPPLPPIINVQSLPTIGR